MTTNIGFWEQVLQAPTPAYQELFKAEEKYLIENIPEDATVLDIGCGEGRNVFTISRKTKNVIGLDNDPIAIRDAEKRFQGTDIKFIVGDANSIPFANDYFDTVTLLMILPNIESGKQELFKEVARVTKEGGELIVSTFAETAFEERMRVYRQTRAPIKKIEGTKVIFDEGLGANTSEQFSKDDLELLGSGAGFKIVDCQKVGVLAYICKFKK